MKHLKRFNEVKNESRRVGSPKQMLERLLPEINNIFKKFDIDAKGSWSSPHYNQLKGANFVVAFNDSEQLDYLITGRDNDEITSMKLQFQNDKWIPCITEIKDVLKQYFELGMVGERIKPNKWVLPIVLKGHIREYVKV